MAQTVFALVSLFVAAVADVCKGKMEEKNEGTRGQKEKSREEKSKKEKKM